MTNQTGRATVTSAEGSRIVVCGLSANATIYDWSGSTWQPVGGFNLGRGRDLAISSSGDRIALAAPGETTDSVGMITVLESAEIDRALCGGSFVTVNLAYGETPTEGDDVIRGTAGDDVIESNSTAKVATASCAEALGGTFWMAAQVPTTDAQRPWRPD